MLSLKNMLLTLMEYKGARRRPSKLEKYGRDKEEPLGRMLYFFRFI
jgi:hypothetical protein